MTDWSLFDSLNNAKNLSGADKQMLFQQRMSDTAHVREVQDLQAAGLNPVLSAHGQGASTPSGAEDEDYSAANPAYLALNALNKVTHSNAKSLNKAINALEHIAQEKAAPDEDPLRHFNYYLQRDERTTNYNYDPLLKYNWWLQPPPSKDNSSKGFMSWFQDLLKRSEYDYNKNPTNSGLFKFLTDTTVGKEFKTPLGIMSMLLGQDLGKMFNLAVGDGAKYIRGKLGFNSGKQGLNLVRKSPRKRIKPIRAVK